MKGTPSAISWRTTRRSRSFDKTGRFEIGRYELALVASSPGFLTIGVINASLNVVGKWPAWIERLKSSVINGAITSTICFSTDVGIGSAADDLSGSRQTALMTSSTVRGRNCWKETPCGARVNAGAGASAVLDRTLATFSAKLFGAI